MKPRRLWTRARKLQLARLCLAGKSDPEIAAEFGVSVETVNVQRRRQQASRDGVRAVIEATTGQLLEALRVRGYEVRIMREP